MAHLPGGDAQQLWNESGHSWSGLHQALEQHRGKAEGIDNALVNDLLPITKNLEHSGQSFPDSAQQLQDVLNQKLGAGSRH